MKYKLVHLILFALMLQSCGEGSLDPDSAGSTTFEQKFFASGVKLISKSIDSPRAESSMKQRTYKIGPTSRLLTRLEGMNDRSDRAVVNGEKRMYVAISSEEFITNRAPFETALELCPITSNWMMLATWDKAHPFPTSNGKWKKRGGDYASADCVSADTSYPEPEEDTLYYDISNWFIYYVQSRNRNYGLMLKSSLEVTIYGDEDSQRAPHFIWQER